MNTIMNRRQFIKAALILSTGTAVGFWPSVIKSPKKELELELLTDFITWSEDSYVDKKTIRRNLFEILRDGSTIGRATYIGRGYLLTAHHIVENGIDKMQVKRQGSDAHSTSAQEFSIADYNETDDLALLKMPSIDRKANMNLLNRVPGLDERVSTLSVLYGHSKGKRYELDYDGFDYYDRDKKVKNLGKLILPAGSTLFEREGKIQRFDEKKLQEIYNTHKTNAKTQCLTSLNVFNGYSGNPIFLKLEEEKYALVGITIASISMKHIIKTPNNPLHYEGMQQTGGVFVHRDPIIRLITGYINK